MAQLSTCSEEKVSPLIPFLLLLKKSSMALYEDLFTGDKLTFDLTKGQPCFRMNKDFTVLNINSFKRMIKTKYQEGNDDEYFN